MLRFFPDSRLAMNPDLYFEMASRVILIELFTFASFICLLDSAKNPGLVPVDVH